MTTQILSQERLKELLHYDPETGAFTWRKHRGGTAKIGSTAGGVNNKTRYVMIKIDMQKMPAHRLAWLYMMGVAPLDEIDHINQKRSDNRFCNLRSVSRNDNMKNKKRYSNNKSGYSGVNWNKRQKQWIARIQVDGKRIGLGGYKTIAEASSAKKLADIQYGFHENHGI